MFSLTNQFKLKIPLRNIQILQFSSLMDLLNRLETTKSVETVELRGHPSP